MILCFCAVLQCGRFFFFAICVDIFYFCFSKLYVGSGFMQQISTGEVEFDGNALKSGDAKSMEDAAKEAASEPVLDVPAVQQNLETRMAEAWKGKQFFFSCLLLSPCVLPYFLGWFFLLFAIILIEDCFFFFP